MATQIRNHKPLRSKYNKHRVNNNLFYRVRNFVNWLLNTELGIYCLLTVMAFVWAIVYLYAVLKGTVHGY